MIKLPRIISGTSSLGNLYEALSYEQKLNIVNAYLEGSTGPAAFDTAGKYGAGLALETLGRCLEQLNVRQDDVIISNKLGWKQVPLTTQEPTFEPGIWKGLKHDAVQTISYDGITECFHQGNELLGAYPAQLVSVHDPDDYLAAAGSAEEQEIRYADILDAYRGLHDLKSMGAAKYIGIGAKDWKTVRRISRTVPLDWVMLANSLTIYHHPGELLDFVEELNRKGIVIINSAVFHGGFLTGGDYFNYQAVSEQNEDHKALFEWRRQFYALCQRFEIKPAVACVHFAMQIPGVSSIALNSSSSTRTRQNTAIFNEEIPPHFWDAMKEERLLEADYPFL